MVRCSGWFYRMGNFTPGTFANGAGKCAKIRIFQLHRKLRLSIENFLPDTTVLKKINEQKSDGNIAKVDVISRTTQAA